MRMPFTIGCRAWQKDRTTSPKQLFLENLRLKALTYDSERFYEDDMASSQLPLKPHSFLAGERELEYIFKLGYLQEEVEFFFSKSKTFRLHERELWNLKLPIAYDPGEMSGAFGFDPYHISDRRDVLFAIEHGPIRSAEKLAALLNEDIADLHFATLRRNPLLQDDGIDPMLFTCFNPTTNELNFVRCIVVPLAPWEFTSEDFDNFTQLGVFTESDDNTDLMWSYLHDVCTIYECDYFILTTYENWAFGRFSHTYAQALISEPISRTSKDLVMKYLTYWILNSCYTTDTAVIQEVFKHELQYYLVKVTEKSSNGKPGREKYQLAVVNHERITGRPISPDPFSDYDSEPEPEDELLGRPCYEFNRWHRTESQVTHSEQQDNFDFRNKNDKEMKEEEGETAQESTPEPDPNTLESSLGSLMETRMPIGVEIDEDGPQGCQADDFQPEPCLDSKTPPRTSEDAEIIQDVAVNSVLLTNCESESSDVVTEFTGESHVEMSMDVDETPTQNSLPISFNGSDTLDVTKNDTL